MSQSLQSAVGLLRNPRVWVAAVSIGLVAGFVASDLTRTAPGPISAVHARERKLVGMGSCRHCHGGWFGNMTSSCLECHAPIAGQIEQHKGLHGSFAEDRARRCATCHSEHHGDSFTLVNRASFGMAGVPDPATFDHHVVGYAMEGRHLELECAKCHANAEAALLPEGEMRYLGLAQSCTSCHKDAHEGRMVLRCEQCHGQTDFKKLESRGHEKHLPLIGGHADVECRKCHAANDPHSLEALGEAHKPGRDRQCADCHVSPHTAAFIGAASKLHDRPEQAVCVVCHEAEHKSFRDERLQMTAEQHACSGFPLDVPHDEVACADCHDPQPKDFKARYSGRGAAECRKCHEDVHRGEFDGKPFAVHGCVDCHLRTQFTPHDFTVDKHARTDYALTGSHAKADCHGCHLLPADAGPAVFHGTPKTCDGCHRDAHVGYFDRFARELLANKQGSCAQCHLTTHFAEQPAIAFDHARWTGFPIQGAHEQAGCEGCHPLTKLPDENGRTFGKVAEHFGKYTGCVTCHKDPHQGEFDRPELVQRAGDPLPRGEVESGCARCHVQTSFRAFPKVFEHARWTGFPLQGAHQKAECEACHPRLAQADAVGRSWARAIGNQCTDCHKDNHAGQFDVNGRTDCRRCHRGADSFKDLVFQHDVQSRFALGEQHEKVPCASCHKPFRARERDVIRYRPLPVECVDCHGDARTPFSKRPGASPTGGRR